nr:MAG TPA: hypothetical protein [Caudoviricetes sp.]
MRTPFQFTVCYLYKATIARRTAAIMYTNIRQRFCVSYQTKTKGTRQSPSLCWGSLLGFLRRNPSCSCRPRSVVLPCCGSANLLPLLRPLPQAPLGKGRAAIRLSGILLPGCRCGRKCPARILLQALRCGFRLRFQLL